MGLHNLIRYLPQSIPSWGLKNTGFITNKTASNSFKQGYIQEVQKSV